MSSKYSVSHTKPLPPSQHGNDLKSHEREAFWQQMLHQYEQRNLELAKKQREFRQHLLNMKSTVPKGLLSGTNDRMAANKPFGKRAARLAPIPESCTPSTYALSKGSPDISSYNPCTCSNFTTFQAPAYDRNMHPTRLTPTHVFPDIANRTKQLKCKSQMKNERQKHDQQLHNSRNACSKFEAVNKEVAERNRAITDELRSVKLELRDCMRQIQESCICRDTDEQANYQTKSTTNQLAEEMKFLQCTCDNFINDVEQIRMSKEQRSNLELCARCARGDHKDPETDNSLYGLARQLSRTLLEMENCCVCRKVPEEVRDTVKYLKYLLDILHKFSRRKSTLTCPASLPPPPPPDAKPCDCHKTPAPQPTAPKPCVCHKRPPPKPCSCHKGKRKSELYERGTKTSREMIDVDVQIKIESISAGIETEPLSSTEAVTGSVTSIAKYITEELSTDEVTKASIRSSSPEISTDLGSAGDAARSSVELQKNIAILSSKEVLSDVVSETQMEITIQDDDADVNVSFTINENDQLCEVVTEGPDGIIDSTLRYTASGHVEITTEIINFVEKDISRVASVTSTTVIELIDKEIFDETSEGLERISTEQILLPLLDESKRVSFTPEKLEEFVEEVEPKQKVRESADFMELPVKEIITVTDDFRDAVICKDVCRRSADRKSTQCAYLRSLARGKAQEPESASVTSAEKGLESAIDQHGEETLTEKDAETEFDEFGDETLAEKDEVICKDVCRRSADRKSTECAYLRSLSRGEAQELESTSVTSAEKGLQSAIDQEGEETLTEKDAERALGEFGDETLTEKDERDLDEETLSEKGEKRKFGEIGDETLTQKDEASEFGEFGDETFREQDVERDLDEETLTEKDEERKFGEIGDKTLTEKDAKSQFGEFSDDTFRKQDVERDLDEETLTEKDGERKFGEIGDKTLTEKDAKSEFGEFSDDTFRKKDAEKDLGETRTVKDGESKYGEVGDETLTEKGAESEFGGETFRKKDTEKYLDEETPTEKGAESKHGEDGEETLTEKGADLDKETLTEKDEVRKFGELRDETIIEKEAERDLDEETLTEKEGKSELIDETRPEREAKENLDETEADETPSELEDGKLDEKVLEDTVSQQEEGQFGETVSAMAESEFRETISGHDAESLASDKSIASDITAKEEGEGREDKEEHLVDLLAQGITEEELETVHALTRTVTEQELEAAATFSGTRFEGAVGSDITSEKQTSEIAITGIAAKEDVEAAPTFAAESEPSELSYWQLTPEEKLEMGAASATESERTIYEELEPCASLATHRTETGVCTDVCKQVADAQIGADAGPVTDTTEKGVCADICKKWTETAISTVPSTVADTMEKGICADICKKRFETSVSAIPSDVDTTEKGVCADICKKRVETAITAVPSIVVDTTEKGVCTDVCKQRTDTAINAVPSTIPDTRQIGVCSDTCKQQAQVSAVCLDICKKQAEKAISGNTKDMGVCTDVCKQMSAPPTMKTNVCSDICRKWAEVAAAAVGPREAGVCTDICKQVSTEASTSPVPSTEAGVCTDVCKQMSAPPTMETNVCSDICRKWAEMAAAAVSPREVGVCTDICKQVSAEAATSPVPSTAAGVCADVCKTRTQTVISTVPQSASPVQEASLCTDICKQVAEALPSKYMGVCTDICKQLAEPQVSAVPSAVESTAEEKVCPDICKQLYDQFSAGGVGPRPGPGPVDDAALRQEFTDALKRASQEVMEALEQANKEVAGALEKAHRDISLTLDLSMAGAAETTGDTEEKPSTLELISEDSEFAAGQPQGMLDLTASTEEALRLQEETEGITEESSTAVGLTPSDNIIEKESVTESARIEKELGLTLSENRIEGVLLTERSGVSATIEGAGQELGFTPSGDLIEELSKESGVSATTEKAGQKLGLTPSGNLIEEVSLAESGVSARTEEGRQKLGLTPSGNLIEEEVSVSARTGQEGQKLGLTPSANFIAEVPLAEEGSVSARSGEAGQKLGFTPSGHLIEEEVSVSARTGQEGQKLGLTPSANLIAEVPLAEEGSVSARSGEAGQKLGFTPSGHLIEEEEGSVSARTGQAKQRLSVTPSGNLIEGVSLAEEGSVSAKTGEARQKLSLTPSGNLIEEKDSVFARTGEVGQKLSLTPSGNLIEETPLTEEGREFGKTEEAELELGLTPSGNLIERKSLTREGSISAIITGETEQEVGLTSSGNLIAEEGSISAKDLLDMSKEATGADYWKGEFEESPPPDIERTLVPIPFRTDSGPCKDVCSRLYKQSGQTVEEYAHPMVPSKRKRSSAERKGSESQKSSKEEKRRKISIEKKGSYMRLKPGPEPSCAYLKSLEHGKRRSDDHPQEQSSRKRSSRKGTVEETAKQKTPRHSKDSRKSKDGALLEQDQKPSVAIDELFVAKCPLRELRSSRNEPERKQSTEKESPVVELYHLSSKQSITGATSPDITEKLPSDFFSSHSKKPHPPDCNCFDCLCATCPDLQGVCQATSAKFLANAGKDSPFLTEEEKQAYDDIKLMDSMALVKHIEETERESLQQKKDMAVLQEKIKEVLCVCEAAEGRTTDSSPLARTYVAKQKSSFHLTLSGLNLALSTLRNKCKQKDRMIETIAAELRLRTSSSAVDNLLNRVKTQTHLESVLDFNRTEVCKLLPRPETSDQRQKPSTVPSPTTQAPEEVPEMLLPLFKSLLKCSHAEFPNCPCVTGALSQAASPAVSETGLHKPRSQSASMDVSAKSSYSVVSQSLIDTLQKICKCPRPKYQSKTPESEAPLKISKRKLEEYTATCKRRGKSTDAAQIRPQIVSASVPVHDSPRGHLYGKQAQPSLGASEMPTKRYESSKKPKSAKKFKGADPLIQPGQIGASAYFSGVQKMASIKQECLVKVQKTSHYPMRHQRAHASIEEPESKKDQPPLLYSGAGKPQAKMVKPKLTKAKESPMRC